MRIYSANKIKTPPSPISPNPLNAVYREIGRPDIELGTSSNFGWDLCRERSHQWHPSCRAWMTVSPDAVADDEGGIVESLVRCTRETCRIAVLFISPRLPEPETNFS